MPDPSPPSPHTPPHTPPPVPPAVAPAPLAPQPAALDRQARRLALQPRPVWLNDEIGRRLADKLDAILIQPRSWLDWGAWCGGASDGVARRHPQARAWLVESHDALARASAAGWVQAHPRPWWKPWGQGVPPLLRTPVVPRDLGLPEGVDLVWANMGLHALPDPEAVFRQWHAALATHGFLMCSGLGPDTLGELRDLFQEEGWGPATLRFTDMHDLGDALVRAGFADPVMDMERLTLTWADAPALLAEVRTWGGNVAQARFAGCRTPRWRERLLQRLQQRLGQPDGRLALTVEVVYGHAVKPVPKALLQEETRVSVDDMRRMIKSPRTAGR